MNARRILATLLVAACTGALHAQDHPMEAPGFVPNKVYDFHDIDSVNTLNGNLIVKIPIGPAFHVNGNLSYALALHYNSHAWRFWNDDSYNFDTDPMCQGASDFPRYICFAGYAAPSKRSNVAMGWTISLGRLWGPNEPENVINNQGNGSRPEGTDGFSYEDADGATHIFTLPAGVEGPTILSRDGSYLRLREDHDLTNVFIDSRDGLTRQFEKAGTLTNWRLKKISDAAGNHVDITYPDEFTWNITDVTGRTITVKFVSGAPYLLTLLQEVDLPSPNGGQSVYKFDTASTVSMPMPANIAHPVSTTPINVPVLQSITPPPGTSKPYTFTKADGTLAYESVASESTGCLQRMTIPSGATYAWEYIADHGHHRGVFSPSVETPVEVATRTITDVATGSTAVWHYQYLNGYYSQCTDLTLAPYERITAISRPDNTVEVSHYNILENTKCLPTDGIGETWNFSDYGLPFTRTTVECAMPWYRGSVGDRKCAHSTARLDPVTAQKEYLSTETFDSAGNILQSRYVAYEGDSFNVGEDYLPNARVSAEVAYDEDTTTAITPVSPATQSWMTCPPYNNSSTYAQRMPKLNDIFTATHRFNYRQFGNYATTISTGRGADGALTSRTTYTDYPTLAAATMATYAMDVPSGTCVADGYVDTMTPGATAASCAASLTSPFITLFDYDQPHNLLNGKRVLVASSPGSKDLLVHYLHDDAGSGQVTNGNLTAEAYEGGDNGTLSSTPFAYSDISQGSIPSDGVGDSAPADLSITRHHYTYSSGGGVTGVYSYHVGDHNFRLSDFTIDAPSGTIKSSRDASGLETDFTYDDLGRLITVTPPGGAQTSYTYKETSVPMHVDATTTLVGGGGTPFKRARYEYDALGRLWHEKTWIKAADPDIAPSTRTTRYDGMSRVVAVSPLQATVSECQNDSICTLTSYDALGRVAIVTAPDGFNTSFSYDGGARTVTTQDIDLNATRTTTTKTENNDGLGRLHIVSDPVDPVHPTNTTGTYDYDAAGHLKKAEVKDTFGNSQTRTFTYDHRGFLIGQNHPENGPASYTYDARGHMLRKLLDDATQLPAYVPKPSLFDQAFTYDTAERVLGVFTRPSVSEAFTQVMKEFAYTDQDGNYSSATDYSKGKLQVATRHNYQTAGDVEVAETYRYTDPAGRLTFRQTAICIRPDPVHAPATCNAVQSLTQSTTYTETGLPYMTKYPGCDAGTIGCAAPTWGSVTRTYDEGHLTKVENEAQPVASLAYAGNGMLTTITHGSVGNSVDTIQPDDKNQPRPKSITVTGQTAGCAVPTWAVEPSDQTIQQGSTFNFTASANGTGVGSASYSWTDGTNVYNAQSWSAAINATTTYTLTITGTCGSLTRTFTLTTQTTAPACQAPTFTTQPVGGTFAFKQVPPPLTALATVPTGGSLSYAWQEEGNGGPALATGPTFPQGPLYQSRAYYAIATNTCGSTHSSTNSAYAILIVQLPAPTNLVATAGSGGVTVTWTQSNASGSGALPIANYEIWRTLSGGAGWQLVASPIATATSWTDNPLSLPQAAVYKIRAVELEQYQYVDTPITNDGPFSNNDVATRITFSALPHDVGIGPLTELLQAINAVRVAAGMPTQTWTQLVNSAPLAGGQAAGAPILALRTSLNGALSSFSIPTPPYTDDGFPPGTPIKKVHITELQGRTQ